MFAGMPLKVSPRASLAFQVAIPVGLALATNGLIFALGWNQPDHDIQPSWAPPGYVIGIVWTLLFACMGVARWCTKQARNTKGARLISFLIALCLAYPFYTAGLQDRIAGLAGIAVTLAFTAYIVVHLRRVFPPASLFLMPLLLWLCFAGVLVIEVNRLNG